MVFLWVWVFYVGRAKSKNLKNQRRFGQFLGFIGVADCREEGVWVIRG